MQFSIFKKILIFYLSHLGYLNEKQDRAKE